jgi:diguanylate cyclase (GGDEF)-like protein/PAS domain S-box-containing protein
MTQRLPNRLYGYITLVVIATAVLIGVILALGIGREPQARDWFAAAILAPMVAMCLRFPLHVAPKQEHDMSVAPIMAAIMLLPGPLALAVCALGMMAGESTKSTFRPAQLIFNTASISMSVAAAVLALAALGLAEAQVRGAAGIAVAAVTYPAVLITVTEGIVSTQLQQRPFRDWWPLNREGFVHESALLVIGVFAGRAAESEPWALPLIGVPCAVLYRSLRFQHARLADSEASLAKAEESRNRLTAIVEATPDFVATADPDGRVHYLNKAGRKMLGLQDEGPPPASLDEVLPTWPRAVEAAVVHDTWSGEGTVAPQDGGIIPVSQVVIAHRGPGGGVDFISTVVRDITERKRFETRLRDLADHDALTGLLNRRAFDEALVAEIARPGPRGQFALILIDLDGFKAVNDQYGHARGDQLLKVIAGALHESIPGGRERIARLGGDEFAIISPGAGETEARDAANRALKAIQRVAVSGPDGVATVSASIGIALYPGHAKMPPDLFRQADTAMYEAKQASLGVKLWQAAA